MEECEELRRAVSDLRAVRSKSGHMKRFDPGIAFARQFIREEMGVAVGPEGLVLRFDLSLYYDRLISSRCRCTAKRRVSQRAIPRATSGATSC